MNKDSISLTASTYIEPCDRINQIDNDPAQRRALEDVGARRTVTLQDAPDSVCSTAVVRLLDKQLIDEMNEIEPNCLVSFAELNVDIGEAVHAVLQLPAKEALDRAISSISQKLQHESDVKVVAQASNGEEALTMFREHQPDVTLMDLRMPQMDGVATIAAICGEFSTARIVVLTTYDGDENIYRGSQAGAKGYLLKDAEPEELLAAIRAVFEGKNYIPLAVGVKLADRLSGPSLSDRELEVIRLIVAGKSNHEISQVLHRARKHSQVSR